MAETGAYGKRMADHFHLHEAPAFRTQVLHTSFVAATRLTCDSALFTRTKPIPPETSYVIEWQLGPSNAHELRSPGSMPSRERSSERGVGIVDLEREHTAYLDAPFDCLHFYLPRRAMDDLAREHGVRPIAALVWPRGTVDRTVNCLGTLLLATLGPAASGFNLFRDSLLLALTAHFATAYGGMQQGRQAARGGLAPWQMRRATELLNAHIDGEVSLNTLATECRLSVSHFARAFRASSGKAPHRWLIERRVDRAKELLGRRDLPLADIALQCGFSEQATFSRSFKREVGTSPGLWRRLSQA